MDHAGHINLLKLLVFIKIVLYHNEYSRDNRPLSVILYLLAKIS